MDSLVRIAAIFSLSAVTGCSNFLTDPPVESGFSEPPFVRTNVPSDPPVYATSSPWPAFDSCPPRKKRDCDRDHSKKDDKECDRDDKHPHKKDKD
jgi:hypothetical protein